MSHSAQGITVSFGSTSLGGLIDVQSDDGVVVLDETTMEHTAENNQAGIGTFSGTVECLGTKQAIKGTVASLALGGTVTETIGICLCTGITLGAKVKDKYTWKYSFVRSVET